MGNVYISWDSGHDGFGELESGRLRVRLGLLHWKELVKRKNKPGLNMFCDGVYVSSSLFSLLSVSSSSLACYSTNTMAKVTAGWLQAQILP